MNILFISPQPYPYGMAASKRIRLFAEYLALNNNVSVVICGKNNGNNVNEGTREGVKWQFKKFRRLEYFLNIYKIYFLLKRNYVTNNNNIIMHYDGIGLTNFMFAIIGRKLGYKIFTDIVEDYDFTEEKESFLRKSLLRVNVFFDKRLTRYADGIIVISTTLLNKYLALKFNQKFIQIVPISAENLDLNLVKIKNDIFTFVYSGSYGKKDGVKLLIEAFNEVDVKHENIQLILSGKINKAMEILIKSSRNIHYVGLVPDVEFYQFLVNADILLMTRINSKYANAGFPFKLGEYLASGNPVIATDVSDIGYYLENMEEVIMIEPSNKNSLVKAMNFVLENETDFIGLNGKRKCNVCFNPSTNGELLENFIKKTYK